MANFTSYQEGKAAMLAAEAPPRDARTRAAAANGDGSVGEPPSPLINAGGGGGGDGSRFHPPPPSSHLLHAPHLGPQQPGESPAGRAASSSGSLGQLHAAEDPAASSSSSSAGRSSGHIYAAVNVAGASDAAEDIRKCGYLRKQKHGHKRFFVLRAASRAGPSRLEYYDSEKKFRSSLRTAAAAAAASGGATAAAAGAAAPSAPKRVIYLSQCFTVNKRADSKNKYLIALYTKDEYFAIVAENEQEQEDWYVAVSELMSEGKKGRLDSDDLDDGYGTVTPGTVFKEVWQVNVKPKGLGQTKNLTGVHRLCLSAKTAHLVKLNCETPCVNLQLMNIRRCGHSESFFFIEVGRSSSIGPGEIWMQVDDSVVAQSMHETILETMKALKAFAEFRPRSKSQSSGSNPMPFITTRRHLGNLPPSQTGLQRRSRTESVVGTPPSSKSSGASGYRFRTSSEGEGTMNRPFRSATGSLVHLNSARFHHGRQEGDGAGGSSAGAGGSAGASTGCGRYVRAVAGSAATHHARSASLPVSHFNSTTSPVSVSSSSGHGSVSDTLTRPSSASICGSPSDGGFNSSDEYGSSPGDFRYFRVRSNTPDSLGNTPPIREENCLSDYMAMSWSREVFCAGGDAPRDESTSTAEDERLSSSSASLRRRTHSFSRPAGGATGGSGVTVYQKMTQTNFSLDEGSDAALPFGGGLLLRGGPSSSSSSLRSDYSSCSEHSQQSRPATLSRTEAAGAERPPPLPPSSSSSSSAKEDGGYMPMMCGVAASPRDTPPDYMPMQPSPYHHPVSHSPQLFSPALALRSAHHHSQLGSQSSTDSHGYMMMLPGSGGGSPSPGQASPGPHSGSGGNDGAAERPGNGEYMDMSYSGGGGGGCKPSNEGSGGYYTPGTPEGPSKSYSPYFSLPRSYKAPSRERDQKEYGEYVPMSSPAKPVYSSVATASTPKPERGGGDGSASTPSHPPPPYGAHHTTAAMADRRVARPNRLPLGRRSFQGPPRVSEPSAAASAGASTSVPPASASAAVGSAEGPSSPGEYINIEFGDHYPHQQQPPAYPLSARDDPPSLESGDCHGSPPRSQIHQDYMSVEVGANQREGAGCLGKNQSPRPSLVAPWNPPSYIRPLASGHGALGSPGGPVGHWRSVGDDYTDMTFNLGRGDRLQTSPTAVLQHLCIVEGHYGHAPSSSSAASVSPPPPPQDGMPTQPPEPKVVRADPQGRRRHSSETFSSTSSSNSTPSGGGGGGGGAGSSSSAVNAAAAASNGSYPAEAQASRWASSASFDSMWMSMEGLGDPPAHHTSVRSTEMGTTSGTSAAAASSSSSASSASSSSSGAGAARMCRNMSVGYQNGLNYIALELREDGSNAGAVTASGGGGSGGSAVAVAAAGSMPPLENGAYASIDFTKSDGVATTTKD